MARMVLASRTEDPPNCAVYNGTPDDMIARIEGYRARGIKIFSTKPSGEADADIELYRAIAAQRFNGETYIADANRTWSVPTALRVAWNLEQYGFFNIEQPCNSYEECLKVRRQTRLTTGIDESVTDFDVLSKVARDAAADIVLPLGRVGPQAHGSRSDRSGRHRLRQPRARP